MDWRDWSSDVWSSDLHTRDGATAALERFVVQSVGAARRCVLVIHGRGLNSGDAGPVLGDEIGRASCRKGCWALESPPWYEQPRGRGSERQTRRIRRRP